MLVIWPTPYLLLLWQNVIGLIFIVFLGGFQCEYVKFIEAQIILCTKQKAATFVDQKLQKDGLIS